MRCCARLVPGDDYALGLARDGGVVLGVRADSGGAVHDTSFGGGDGTVSNFAEGYVLVDIGIQSDGRILGVTSSGAAIPAFLVSR